MLGISGGVDSLAAALLAQRAVEELRTAGYDAKFLAVRLPYRNQADESDAQRALDTIGADEVHLVDIKPAADAMLDSIKRAGVEFGDAGGEDFLLGNIKARQRMNAQFALAGASRGLVIGTDHAAEVLMGFFTKFGDGAANILPLSGLNKRRVRALAAHLGAPSDLVDKIPTADLENLVPLRPDEDAYGLTYDQIDDFLEGGEINEAAGRVWPRPAHELHSSLIARSLDLPQPTHLTGRSTFEAPGLQPVLAALFRPVAMLDLLPLAMQGWLSDA